MSNLLKTIDHLLALLTIALIRLYQYTLSPDKGIFSPVLKGRVCSHEPHCSEYAIRTLRRYGFRKGFGKATDRVLHCKPSMDKHYDPPHYKIVFFSSAPIGVPFLEELTNDKRFELVGVVTQADKPVWRGLHLQENVIKAAATPLLKGGSDEGAGGSNVTQPSTSPTPPYEGGHFISTPTKINPDKSLEGKAFYDRLQAKQPDFLVVIAYGKILPQSILDTAHFGAINVHGSLLPNYRGASPLQSIFLNNETSRSKYGTSWKLETGLTIMKMDAGMDTGDIIDTFSFPIPFQRTIVELIKALQQKWPKFLNTTLRNYAKGLITPEKQNEAQATYCQKIEKSDGEIQLFETPLSEVYAKYRAFALRPKTRFTLNGKTIIVEKLVIEEEKLHVTDPLDKGEGAEGGRGFVNKELPLITWKHLNPSITEILLKPEGKKAMDRKSFANGYLK